MTKQQFETKTSSWKISSTTIGEIGAGIGAGGKLYKFRNNITVTSPIYYIWVYGLAGLKAGVDISGLSTAVQQAHKLMSQATSIAGNPLSKNMIDKPLDCSSFSYADLAFSVGISGSAGVSAVGSVNNEIFSAFNKGRRLFSESTAEVAIQAAIELNAMSGNAGVMVPLHPSHLAYYATSIGETAESLRKARIKSSTYNGITYGRDIGGLL